MKANLYSYRAVMRSAYDGDSVRADIDFGMNHWMMNRELRLVGIDTPEIRGKSDIEKLLAQPYDGKRERIPWTDWYADNREAIGPLLESVPA